MRKKAVKSSAKRPRTTRRKRSLQGPPKVTPVRLAPKLREGLEMLHGLLKTPINKLINEAVDDFIKKRAVKVAEVEAYRKHDPSFKKAIRRTAEAEARAIQDGVRDPAEGTTYVVQGSRVGPTQSMVRGLLGSR